MRRPLGAGLALLASIPCVLAQPACRRRESVEAARARATERFLEAQVTELKELVGKAESGHLVTKDRIVIGIAEDVVKSVLDASLPQQQTFNDRVVVRIESARAYFRGNNAALVFQASARSLRLGVTARLEMGGRLTDFRIDSGVMTASVVLAHFKVLEAPGGDLASDVLEKLAKDNADALTRLIPRLELPVSLKESIEIAGLQEGVVTARGGTLPLEIAIADTLPVNERLWVLLEVKAGPWKGQAPAPKVATAEKPESPAPVRSVARKP
jgi:hypothetical protein